MYLKGIPGVKVLCKMMKYLLQTGVTPQFITNKIIDVTDVDDDKKAEARREITDFIRKIIAGIFAIRSHDYFRVNPPKHEDHLHNDPAGVGMCSFRSGAIFCGIGNPQQGWFGTTCWAAKGLGIRGQAESGPTERCTARR
jgi:hypothetical protein